MKDYVKLILLVPAAILIVVLGAFTVSSIWEWFFVPSGAQPISMFVGYGMILFATIFTTPVALSSIIDGGISRSEFPKEAEKYRSIATAAGTFMVYSMALVIGFIVSSIFG
jgi:hypothetical protein